MENKIAVVTGGNKGLGKETARQLAKLGYRVIITSRDADRGARAVEALASDGIKVEAVDLDLSSPGSIMLCAQDLNSSLPQIDVLVNNAGVLLDQGRPASQADISLLRETFETNVFGLISFTNQVLPLIRKSSGGRIVNVSSILGSLKINSDPNALTSDWRVLGYNASKAALNMYTVILAQELSETNIKVNSAHPGWVQTDLGGVSAPLTVESGAETAVWLATIPDDGPTGGFFHQRESLPW
jgi:NAD(P)-dependent dehydrogenase (short-subunit alcohol dehydrogenase family)